MREYNSTSIKIYKGLDAVRKRPGMYIGNTDDGSGLHRMVFEVVDNSIDESLAGYCSFIKVELFSNGFISIFDNGRGMPTDILLEEKRSAVEVIMTVLHSGAKFDEKIYRLSGGLHGVGVSVVNALSKKLRLRIFRSGFIYEQNYIFGKPLKCLRIVGHTDKRGTEIKFLADELIYKNLDFDVKLLISRFRELSFLNPKIAIKVYDKRVFPNLFILCENNGGLKAFVKHLNEGLVCINKDVLFFSGKKNGISVNIAMQWVDLYREKILCYTNNIYQRDGGSHLVGLKTALTKAFKIYMDDEIVGNKSKFDIQGDDIREGFVAILSIYMPDPKFSSQIKDKLISLEAKHAVDFILTNAFKDFLYENPGVSKLLLNKIYMSAKSRDAARKARDLSRKKSEFDFVSFSSKLSDCQERNSELSELFLVEGDSAGGSAKQARDRRTQAILPLKGKILNVERASFDKILSNVELKSIISVLNCGFGFDILEKNRLRYNKVIFMTDADVDGSHIRTLLMTFFYRHIPWLIEDGHVFISRPPLYRFQRNKEIFYIRDKLHFNEILIEFLFDELCNLIDVDVTFLRKILVLYFDILSIIDDLSVNYPKVFFEKLFYFNVFLDIQDIKFKKDIMIYQKFLNDNLNAYEKIILQDDLISSGFLKIIYFRYGVSSEYSLSLEFFNSKDYTAFVKLNDYLNSLFKDFKKIKYMSKEYGFLDFSILILTIRKKFLSKYVIQRYKGLGEMNPEQLWHTTMNPETRNLQCIKIKDIIQADGIFSNLMGNNIEERRKFITENSRSFFNMEI